MPPGMAALFPTMVLTGALVLLFTMAPCHSEEPAPAEGAAPMRFRVVMDAPKPLAGTLERGLNLMRWQHDEQMTLDLLQRLVGEARSEVERALAAEGYFSPTVRTAIEPHPDTSVVRITVEPGPRTLVSSVELQFRGTVVDRDPAGAARMDAVRAAWPLMKGEPFRQSEWDAAKRKAVAELAARHYAAAAIVSSEARIDPQQRTATLRVELDSGPPFRLGETRVSGTRRYPESIVQTLNPLQPGEEYEASRLALFQRRLLETGYFATAQVGITPDPANAAAAPLEVTVAEGRSQRIDAGVSFSTDTRLGAALNYTNQDVLDRALRLRSIIKIDSKTELFDTTLDTPPRAGGVWNTFNVKYEREDIQNQRTREGVLGAAYNWGVESTPSQISLSAHSERQEIQGSGIEHNDALYLGYRKTFQLTDNPLLPRRGLLGTLHAGTSVPGLATQQFLRFAAKGHLLVPISKESDFTLRAEGGIVVASSRSGIPSSFLFRTGGDQTVRGYEFESIGVRQGNAIVGGRYLAVASAEYTWWFAGDWGAAAFVDAGDAFDSPSAFDLAVGYGVGARWRSPIGPFRADVAYGQRTGTVRLHFSAGFTF